MEKQFFINIFGNTDVSELKLRQKSTIASFRVIQNEKKKERKFIKNNVRIDFE